MIAVKKVLLIIFSFLSVLILIVRFGTTPLEGLLGIEQKAGVKIESSVVADVNIDNQILGKTPFQKDDLSQGEHLVSLSSDTGSWQGYVKLNGGTLTIVNRELAAKIASSSGEIISLSSGQGVTIISNPTGADVAIDGKSVGKTPLSLSDISLGEHQFNITHANFLPRGIKSIVTNGYNLTLNIDLAIAQVDLTQASTPVVKESVALVVIQTPTGFLNVRDSASLSGIAVEQVKPGDKLILLEELPNWDRVRSPSGKEGYVASSYVQKQTPSPSGT